MQVSMSSWNQRHGPFHTRSGSTPNAFRIIVSVLIPQYAGSAWCVYKAQRGGMSVRRV